MNGLAYDAFSVNSDGSTPRTPSPGSSFIGDSAFPVASGSPASFEPFFGMDGVPSTSTFGREDYSLGSGMRHSGSLDVAPSWQHNMHGGPILQHPPMQGHGRSVLLQELYDHELPPDHVSHSHGHHQQDAYYQHSAEPQYGHGGGDWSATPPSSSHGLPGSPHTLPPMRSAQDGMVRRNTFPYVRHDHDPNGHYGHDNGHHYVQQHPQMLPPFGRPDMMYGEPMPLHAVPGHMPLSAEPSALHAPRLDDGYGHMQHDDHHRSHPYHHGMHDGSVKLEEGGPVMITPQSGFYRPPSSGGMMPYLSPHTGLPIQHTDDAASKETQYLRRRCFNCHTTEPPSWRRSTLNPGKIVCNKCGLYERTHLRPRPLRFDELRAGNKARKAAAAKTSSPKQRVIKKEPGAGSDGIARRSSVSSTTSSSNGGSSDWDDNASVYSNGSSSSFNSPSQSTFSIPRDSASASPPMLNAEGGIRLPTGGLNDIASMPHHMNRDLAHMPHKSASGPAPYQQYPPYQIGDAHGARRNTVNLPLGSAPSADALRRPLSSHGEMNTAPEQWGAMSHDDVTPTGMEPGASPQPLLS